MRSRRECGSIERVRAGERADVRTERRNTSAKKWNAGYGDDEGGGEVRILIKSREKRVR